MFCNNKKLALRIKGVFPVNLTAASVHESERGYSALSFRINGDCSFFSDGKEYKLSSGSVVYIPKGVDYSRVSNKNETLITVHFETFGEDESEIQVIDNCESLHPFFETLNEYWMAKEYNRSIRAVYKIFDEILVRSKLTPAPPPQTIAAGVEYLKSNFRSTDVSIAEAAKRCHVSETYFRRVYKSHFGISPVNTLIDMRFSYAKGLLRSGYYEIKQVAALSGFSDTKYFRTDFKKRFGMTPGEYASANADK